MYVSKARDTYNPAGRGFLKDSRLPENKKVESLLPEEEAPSRQCAWEDVKIYV